MRMKQSKQTLARFPNTARFNVGAPPNARVELLRDADDRDPYGFSPWDDRNLYLVEWDDNEN